MLIKGLLWCLYIMRIVMLWFCVTITNKQSCFFPSVHGLRLTCVMTQWHKESSALTRPCSWWPCLPACSAFWWAQVDSEAVSQPVGALASFWPFRRFPARPAVLSHHVDRFYVSSDRCPLPSPPGTRSLLSQAAGRGRAMSMRQTHIYERHVITGHVYCMYYTHKACHTSALYGQ